MILGSMNSYATETVKGQSTVVSLACSVARILQICILQSFSNGVFVAIAACSWLDSLTKTSVKEANMLLSC